MHGNRRAFDPTDDRDDQLTDETLDAALAPDNWADAGRDLLAKMIAEFAYEDLLDPEPIDEVGAGAEDARWYELAFDGATYRFDATERLMDGLLVREASIERRTDADGGDDDGRAGEWTDATDPVRFFLDARERLGVDEMTAGHLIREYRNTLLADAHLRADRPSAADVVGMEYAEIEGEMTGHPWITYNKGRLGWGYDDHRAYAPESKSPVRLRWLAVRRERATFETVEGLTPERLLREELGGRYDAFAAELGERNLDPDDYAYVPIHEWQWENAVLPLFSGELADDAIVPLGAGEDRYLPGQSVRTFFNRDAPEKRNVKLPMRILNTLVWRGLPGDRTEAAPAVTEFVRSIRDDDPFLREECGLVLPGEVAGVDYDHPEFARLNGNAYQYDELLGAVWRESVVDLVAADERPMTLAALLHVGGDGRPVVSELIDRSPLGAEAWLDELFETTLSPLLHYLYRYGTVFSPHGENAILILDEECVPIRLAVKDFVDDVNVSDRSLPELDSRLSPELDEVLRSEPPEGLCQFVFSGLFVGVFRYLSDLLTEHRDYDEERFWSQVREAVLDYQSRFPELEDRFETFDLLRPEFTKLCLNRNRMTEEGYGDAEGRPHAAEHGAVRNALDEVAED